MEVKVVPVGQTEGLQATHNPILIKDSQPGAVEAPRSLQPIFGLHTIKEPLSVFLAATDKASPGNGGVEVFRLPPGEKDKVVVCAKLKAGDRLCITKALDGWGKLHPSMKDVVRGNPGFKEFDAETEGWVMLWDSAPLALWRIESIEGRWSVCVLKAGDAKLSAPVLELPLDTQDGAEVDTVCGTLGWQDKVYASGISRDGCWAKLDPVMYHALSLNDDFRPFAISELGWVRISADAPPKTTDVLGIVKASCCRTLQWFRLPLLPAGFGDDWVEFESTHHLLFARDVNPLAQLGALGLIAVQICLLYQMSLSTAEGCSRTDNWYMWKMGIPLCCLYAGATTAGDLVSCVRMVTYVNRSYSGESGFITELACTLRIVVIFLVEIMDVFQLYAIGVVMAKSQDLIELVSNFIGVAVVSQCDELVASVFKIPCPDPAFYKLSSKDRRELTYASLLLTTMLGLVVYLATVQSWIVCIPPT